MTPAGPSEHVAQAEGARPLSAAERFSVIEKPDLTFTPEIARETEHLYEKVKQFVQAYQSDEVYKAAYDLFKGGLVKGW